MLKMFKNEEKFFSIFEEMSVHMVKAVTILAEIVRDPAGSHGVLAAQIKDLEHKGDDLTHRVIDELNKAFITPIDREDIHDLSKVLDDVIDLIDAIAARMVMFNLREVIPGVPEMCVVLTSQIQEIGSALRNLHDHEAVIARCIEINRLENDADRLFQTAIGRLFSEITDPIEVIKRKEIIETIEAATDKAEDVANVLQTIMVKNA
jgi:predicted phosphate transport protein (TIGR00153 family)